MDIKNIILQKLAETDHVRVSDIVRETGFSRVYINRFFQELREEGRISLVGKANQARYVASTKQALLKEKRGILKVHRTLQNKNLTEEIVLAGIQRDTGIFLGLRETVRHILEYAFTEMLNNAIEHSRSDSIEISMKRDNVNVVFEVQDRGIGIFNNLMMKRKLQSELEAIQDLLKGKQTTAPKEHSGEGIFFTSRVADILVIQSSTKKILFNNIVEDVFVQDIPRLKGTKVIFTIGLKARQKLSEIFKEYADESFEFSKTKVVVKLYKMDSDYISRSQARRIMSGLEKFQTIVLDFDNVETVGQAFADEVFRVWASRHPKAKIYHEHANDNIEFMIRRSLPA